MYMNNQDFETLIKPYTEKVVDDDNSAIVKYTINRRFRCEKIKLGGVSMAIEGHKRPTSIAIRTPVGNFNSVNGAVKALGINTHTLNKLCQVPNSGYEYI